MCLDCQRRWREEQETGEKMANDHFDQAGVSEDDLIRAMTSLQIACNVNPMLDHVLHRAWPSRSALMQ
jgi:hypothetical protein